MTNVHIRITHESPFASYPAGMRFASVKPRPRYVAELSYPPDTAPMGNDVNDGKAKGAQVIVEKNLWKHLEYINDEKGMIYCRSVGAMMINPQQNYNPDHLYETAKSESVTCGCNVVGWTESAGTHKKLYSINADTLTSELNTPDNNWMRKPWLYAKLQGVNWQTRFIKVYSQGVPADVYWLRVNGPGQALWMHNDYLELWPESISGKLIEYRFYGLNVYDGSLARPLMLTDAAGVRSFYNGFKINTPNVIPPADWAQRLAVLGDK